MKKTLMKYVSLALASTLLTSCVSFLDTNQNLNHQIPKGFTGVWIEKKPTQQNCYPATDYIEYTMWQINPKKKELSLATSFDANIYHFTDLSNTAFSSKARFVEVIMGELDEGETPQIIYENIEGKIINKNQILINGKKLYRCPKPKF